MRIVAIILRAVSDESGYSMEWTVPYEDGMNHFNQLVMRDDTRVQHSGSFDDLTVHTLKPLVVERANESWYYYPVLG